MYKNPVCNVIAVPIEKYANKYNPNFVTRPK